MKRINFIIFFSIALTIYGAINFYIFIRGWEVIPIDSTFRVLYASMFAILAFSYIAGRFLERITLSWFSSTLVWIGSFWLGMMVHLFLSILCIDVLRLVHYGIPIFPSFITQDYAATVQITGTVVFTGALVTVIAGYFNAAYPRVRVLKLHIPKNTQPQKSLTLAVASDIHLGTIICKQRLERIVEKINTLNPDLVLLPGDVVDEDLGPVLRQNLGETLRKINSRLGVVAVTGNHEYIGGVEEAHRYLVDHGITMLRDEVIKIEDSLYIVGREDRSISQFAGKKRKSLKDLVQNVDRRLPVILMDHQPFHLEESEQNGVDLQLSGHTHHGQLWPFHFITKKVYELSWGYVRKGNTHIYVSCGVGTWGPPVRTGNRPEIVKIELTFD